MANVLRYWALVTLHFVFLCVYNIIFFSTYASTICCIIQPTSLGARILTQKPLSQPSFLPLAYSPQYNPNSDTPNQDSIIIHENTLAIQEFNRIIQTTNTTNTTATNTTATNTTATNTTATNTTATNATTTPLLAGFNYGCLSANSSIESSSVKIWLMPEIIGAFYGVSAGLLLITTLGMFCYGDKLSTYFKSFAWYHKAWCFLVKTFPIVVTVVHYVIFILIIVQFYFLLGKEDCKNASILDDTTGEPSTGTPYSAAITTNLVTIVFWILLHCVYPNIKHRMYIDPFIYTPVDPDRNPVIDIVLVKLGP